MMIDLLMLLPGRAGGAYDAGWILAEGNPG